ncbi:BrnT family toxin [Allostella humosa]
MRVVAIGQVADICFCVVYTDRDAARRIISARRANRKECKLWQEVGE